MFGDVEAFSMIAIELVLNRGLQTEEMQRLPQLCASLLSQPRSENILVEPKLASFLRWSMPNAYGMRMPRVYAAACKCLFPVRNSLRRWGVRASRASVA